MARSYSSRDLIQLPNLTAEEAFTLSARLDQAASEERLPADVGARRDGMLTSQSALRQALIAQRVGHGRDTRAAVEADRAIDAVWGATRDWLGAFHALGARAPRASEIAELYSFLFGHGLAFLTSKYDVQW